MLPPSGDEAGDSRRRPVAGRESATPTSGRSSPRSRRPRRCHAAESRQGDPPAIRRDARVELRPGCRGQPAKTRAVGSATYDVALLTTGERERPGGRRRCAGRAAEQRPTSAAPTATSTPANVKAGVASRSRSRLQAIAWLIVRPGRRGSTPRATGAVVSSPTPTRSACSGRPGERLARTPPLTPSARCRAKMA